MLKHEIMKYKVYAIRYNRDKQKKNFLYFPICTPWKTFFFPLSDNVHDIFPHFLYSRYCHFHKRKSISNKIRTTLRMSIIENVICLTVV